MIGVNVKSGDGNDSCRLFRQMQHEGVKPNEVTYMTLLNPNAIAGDFVEWVKGVHCESVKAGLDSNIGVGIASSECI